MQGFPLTNKQLRTNSDGSYQNEHVAGGRRRLVPREIFMHPWQSRDVANVGRH